MTDLEKVCRSFKKPAGAVRAGEEISFLVPFDAPELVLLVKEDSTGEIRKIRMEKTEEGFSCGLSCPQEGLVFYAFAAGKRYLTAGEQGLETAELPDWVQQTVYAASYRQPEGFAGRVAYQIFPDRFAVSGGIPHFPGRRYHEDLSEQPYYTAADGGATVCDDFYGGSFAGITESLDYLSSLGVGLLYLNPICLSPSNHRYDTSDYLTPDPQLGTVEEFRELCRRCRERDIRVLLDGVFSHTGADSVYFDREGRFGGEGAYCRKDSPYAGWYRFREWPDDYECWWDFPTLPNVEEMDPSYLSFITGEGGVIDTWMARGASGFRLDVADELPDAFIEKVREAVKRNDPDGLLIGEVWEDASCKISYGERRKYFWGRELDGVMGYPVREAVLDFVREADARLFRERIEELLLHYPQEMLSVCLNLIGSHDTARAINMLAAPEGAELSREEQAVRVLGREEYLRGVEMLKLSFALLLWLPGIPMLYYGDEGGMQGYKDPFCRGFYRREAADRQLLDAVREMIRERNRYAELLKDAKTEFFLASEGAVGFLRGEGPGRIAFLLNRGEETVRIRVDADRTLEVPPWSYRVTEL